MKKSDVTIICQEKAYEQFAEAWQGADYTPSIKVGHNTEGTYYMLKWSDVVWNGWNPQVGGVLNTLEVLNGISMDGYAFRCVEVTEECEIFSIISDPEDVFYDFCVSIEVLWPEEMKELHGGTIISGKSNHN